MRLIYSAPETPHPNSNGESIYEVAVKLEKQYKLLEKFTSYIKPELIKRLDREFAKKNPNLKIVDEWIKNKWRQWILDGNYGIITHASRNRGNQAFVDSGAYYQSIFPRLEYDNAKRNMYK